MQLEGRKQILTVKEEGEKNEKHEKEKRRKRALEGFAEDDIPNENEPSPLASQIRCGCNAAELNRVVPTCTRPQLGPPAVLAQTKLPLHSPGALLASRLSA